MLRHWYQLYHLASYMLTDSMLQSLYSYVVHKELLITKLIQIIFVFMQES